MFNKSKQKEAPNVLDEIQLNNPFESLKVETQPVFSMPYQNAHPSKFMRLKTYVNKNLPDKMSKILEDTLDEITDIYNKVHQSNLIVLFQKLKIINNFDGKIL